MKLSVAIVNMSCLLAMPQQSFATNLRGAEDLQSPRTLSETTNVLCRMSVSDTMYEDGTSDERSVCIPILDLQETDYVVPFDVPLELEEVDKIRLDQGRLFVNITNAQLTEEKISLTTSSEIFFVDKLPTHLRHLQERNLKTTGDISLAIVRIVTNSRSPSVSSASLQTMMDDSETNLFSQYNSCSGGKLKWKKASHPVVDVRVGNTGNKGKIIRAAQEQVIKDLNLGSITDLADRILFCVPPGTGSWIGAATTNHWRAELNDPYCNSLSASMHELGHTVGLHHAWKGSDKYGDATGYMGRSYPGSNWPMRCFNGAHSDQLGWYSDRTLEMAANDRARLVRLAGAVDYTKSAPDEPVLIKVAGNVFVQYNRLKDFNSGTGESLDSVAITELASGRTQFLGSVRPGETYRHGNVLIQACQRLSSTTGGADVMFVSIGTGAAVCDQAETRPFVSVVSTEERPPTPSTEVEAEETPFPVAEEEAPSPEAPVTEPDDDGDSTPFPTATPMPTVTAATLDDNSDPTEESPYGSFDHAHWWQKFWQSLFN